jgi:hypothetical protein
MVMVGQEQEYLTRLKKKWKVYENIVEMLVGVFGVWKEKSDPHTR